MVVALEKLNSVHLDVNNLRFDVFSAEEIRKFSVCKVTSTISFDAIGNPVSGGLYDVAMGPSSKNEICTTCHNDSRDCIGHFGHIELSMPVYNPFFIKTVNTILKHTCLSCYRLQFNDTMKAIVDLQLRLCDAGYIIEAQDLEVLKEKHLNCASSDSEQKFDQRQQKKEDFKEYYIEVMDKYNLLLKEDPTNHYNVTKNSGAIRTAIINSTIGGLVSKNCIHCKFIMKKVKYSYKKLVLTITKKDMEQFKILFASECRDYLTKVFQTDGDFLKILFPILSHTNDIPVNIFFFEVLPVVPPQIRPANRMNDGLMEHAQTKAYYNVISANNQLYYILAHAKRNDATLTEKMLNEAENIFNLCRGENFQEKIYYKLEELQTAVDMILDKDMAQTRQMESTYGLKQFIEKKEGLIRMHMMGKRVNFAARTVITPDPNMDIDQIGVPEAFALKLTYPVPVTTWNVTELRKMVLNGPDKHPGACYIESKNGFKKLIPKDASKREAMANTILTPDKNSFDKNEGHIKIVHRHLINGDVLLLNRQPTLHKPSIMAHKARILKGEKTFRMHYSNCKSYNADFDGDEMNAHFPQNELGRSEAYNLVNVANNYLVPKDGTPLGGLIQDHMIAGVKMSMRGRFFNKEDYQQLVFQGLSHIKGNIKLLPPTILKPRLLWSGKQIFSTLIINMTPKGMPPINLTGTAKINSAAWQSQKARKWTDGGTKMKGNEMTEAEVVIRGGVLHCGVLDKNHYGATPYSLIHCMYELYGGEISTQLLTSFAKVFTIFLQWEGFTLGVHDILVLTKADEKRDKIVIDSRAVGNMATKQALDLPDDTSFEEMIEKMDEAYTKDPKFRAVLDRKYKTTMDGFTNDINKTCLPAGLLCKFPENNLQLMVMSGAKGSTVNTMQISCLLGQIELEGKRPPLMISGKSLPSFPAFETSPKSGGFIDGRFMTGIQPQDFFFHCMAGREGLIDTAVKTSRSGYLQRCLVKHLEGLKVSYDGTVRDSDNSVVQYMYGEDGMDILKSQFLKKEQIAFLNDNHQAIYSDQLLEQVGNTPEMDEELSAHKKKIRVWRKRNGNDRNHHRIAWKENKRIKKTPNPTMSTYKPNQYFGSVSEYAESILESYLKEKPEQKESVNNMMFVKSLKSLADAGEPVGMLAAQSIGEPSTQMTLNTFHFAGRGDMNVTLGIPRLREILMMASGNIKTPSMDIPFANQNSENLDKTAEKFRVRLNRVTVSDVLEDIKVKSKLELNPRARYYEFTFKFLPQDAYKQNFLVKPKRIIKYMHETFMSRMFKYIDRATRETVQFIEKDEDLVKKTRGKAKDSDDEDDPKPKESKSKVKNNVDSSDDEDAGDDADATDDKKKARQGDENTYEDPEAEEAEESDSDNEGDEEGEDVKVKQEMDVSNAGEEQLDEIERKENELEREFEGDSKIMNKLWVDNATSSTILDFFYDKKNYQWCCIKFTLPLRCKNIDMTNVLREAASSAIIWQVPKIKRAITFKQNEVLMLKTEGINIHAMFEFDKILDLNKLYTNDIHAISKTYGIEAAGRVIVKEVQNVFKVYGITVNPRHLLLIADYMTADGTFKPLNRRGMDSSASPLQQISFESALTFLKDATVQGRVDNIDSPSSCLMLGHPCKTGTGSFGLINDLEMALKKVM
ncbi:unnamed protein product [Diamesa tonsa]